jgi:hypothetical protein
MDTMPSANAPRLMKPTMSGGDALPLNNVRSEGALMGGNDDDDDDGGELPLSDGDAVVVVVISSSG